VIVESTDAEDVAVLYVWVYSDSWERECEDCVECTDGGGLGGVGVVLTEASFRTVVDGWFRGDLRRGGRGSNAMSRTV